VLKLQLWEVCLAFASAILAPVDVHGIFRQSHNHCSPGRIQYTTVIVAAKETKKQK
jgi:hypothetical protein